MTHITLFKDSSDEIRGFCSAGHAGAGIKGEDIVCSAISALTFNLLNSIEAFSEDKFEVSLNEKEGIIIMNMTSDSISMQSQILLKSFELGINSIADENPKYLSIEIKEV